MHHTCDDIISMISLQAQQLASHAVAASGNPKGSMCMQSMCSKTENGAVNLNRNSPRMKGHVVKAVVGHPCRLQS